MNIRIFFQLGVPDETAPSAENEVQTAKSEKPVEQPQETQEPKNSSPEETSEDSSSSEMEHESGTDTDVTYVTDESNFAWGTQ